MGNPPISGKATVGGMLMNARDYWTIFMETGAPEMYLLFHHARRREEAYVSDDSGVSSESIGLQ